MGDELDALFDELFDDDEHREADEESGQNPKQSASPDAAQVLPEADQAEDMLLFLADECALNVPQQLKAPAPPGHVSSSSIPGGSAVVNKSASAHTPGIKPTSNNGSSAAAVRMSQSKAFTVINGSKQAANGLSTHGSASRSASLGLGGTSGVHNSSSTSSKAGRQQSSNECQHFVEKLTSLKIKNPRVSGIVLRERYKQFTYVPISKARDHSPTEGQHWLVIGVLVSKSISTTSSGSPYSRWRISDLAGNDTWVSLFGDAHKDNYAEAEGSVLAFYNPKFTSKGPGGSSSSSNGLAVSQPHQIELLATSLAWGFCRGKTKTNARCNNAVDTSVSCYCQYHALQHAKTLRKPAVGVGKRGSGGVGGVRVGLGLAAAADGGSGVAAAAAVASNGKVFDARSNSWSSTATQTHISSSSSSGSLTKQNAGGGSSSTLKKPGVGGSGSKSGGSSGGGSGGSAGWGSGGQQQQHHQQQVSGVEAAAACQQRDEMCPQARQRREQQAEVREALRRKMLQQQQQQQDTRQTPYSKGSSSTGTTLQRAPPAQLAAAPRASSFSLKALIADVQADSKQQQRQEEQQQLDERGDWIMECQQQQKPPAAAGGDEKDVRDDSEICDDRDDLVIQPSSSNQLAAAAAAGQPAAAAEAVAQSSGAMQRLARYGSSSGGGSSSSSRAGSGAQKRLRADLGLGPKCGGGSSSSSSGAQKPPHVSRIGTVGAKAATAAGYGSSSSNSGFKAAFGRVLQRTDVNKPDAKLLDAAADQKHAAMMGKLLDQYEQKDQLAQQLEGITKLQVTAFECRTCKALTEKRRATCSSHDVVPVRVTKRWWTCDACGWKIHTLRDLMPTKRCPKCRDPGVMFTAASAYNAPKVHLSSVSAIENAVASKEGMLPRGIEHAFCLQNSL